MYNSARSLMHFVYLPNLYFAVVVDEDKPIVNQSIVQEVVEASQRSFSQDLCKCSILHPFMGLSSAILSFTNE